VPRNRCPRALELYPRLVSLPLYPAMTEAQLQCVATAVKDVVSAHRRPLARIAAESVNSLTDSQS
jgi:hypothetical protein